MDTKSASWNIHGRLDARIADGIRMFKPKTLKEAIGLARMKNDQIQRQLKASRQNTQPMTDISSPIENTTTSMKRLNWDEMQRRRAQGLCFNCDAKFSAGHKCRGPQLLILEGEEHLDEESKFHPEISVHAHSGL